MPLGSHPQTTDIFGIELVNLRLDLRIIPGTRGAGGQPLVGIWYGCKPAQYLGWEVKLSQHVWQAFVQIGQVQGCVSKLVEILRQRSPGMLMWT